MIVFKIEGPIEAKYRGCGYAIATVAGGRVVDLAYFSDLLPDVEVDSREDVLNIINDVRIGPTVRLFSSMGEVYLGMCSAREFVTL